MFPGERQKVQHIPFIVDGKGTTRLGGVDLTVAEVREVEAGLVGALDHVSSCNPSAAQLFAGEPYHLKQLIKGSRNVSRDIVIAQLGDLSERNRSPKRAKIAELGQIIGFGVGLIEAHAQDHDRPK